MINVLGIRKLVSRGFPYDFSVDRRCVWKFCLFEQFTGETVSFLFKSIVIIY